MTLFLISHFPPRFVKKNRYKVDSGSNKLRYSKCDESSGGKPTGPDGAWEKFYILAGARVHRKGTTNLHFHEGPGGRDKEMEVRLESAAQCDEWLAAIEAGIEYADYHYGGGGGDSVF